MEIGEIITDSLKYPINNIKALIIYIVLGIVAGLVLVLTGVGVGAGAIANSAAATGIVGIIGIIIFFLIYLLILGYELDVINFGIERRDDAPEIDFARQITNGIKWYITCFIYMLIPTIIMIILSYLNQTLGLIVGIILFIIAAFALLMAQCRLAHTDSLGEALNIPEAIKDITKVGIIKIIAVFLILVILGFVVSFILGLFSVLGDVGTYIGAILSGIFTIYLAFVVFRASGLLYSDAV